VKAAINSWTRDVLSSIIFMVKKQRHFVLAVKQSTKTTTQNIPIVRVYEIHRNHFEKFLMEFSLHSFLAMLIVRHNTVRACVEYVCNIVSIITNNLIVIFIIETETLRFGTNF